MKKMRKLIPAFAMLLVSAIMMSTASFAWFTMNDTVTATGMEIKAKAAGNLLISDAPLTALDDKISITFENGKKDLTPVTLGTAPTTQTPAWVIPANGNNVDQTTGDYTGAMQVIDAGTPGDTAANNQYFAEYTVYLATAGDTMTGELWLNLEGVAGIDQAIAPAYSVAVWVGTDATVTAPTARFSYKSFLPAEGGATGAQKVAERVQFPSTFETNATNSVGLKVVVRIYVDGALEDYTKVDVQTKNMTAIAAATTYGAFKQNHANHANYTFYKNGAAESVYNWDDSKDLTGYSYWDGTYTTTSTAVKYVNNQQIPSASTTFEIEFSAKNTTVGGQNP